MALALLARRSESGGAALCHQGNGLDPHLAIRLENAFDGVRDEARVLARSLAATTNAGLAHAPALAPNVSDLPLMLAWAQVATELASDAATYTVSCGDPWLFRHLAGMPGVHAMGAAPPLWKSELRLAARGVLARLAATARFARAHARFANTAEGCPPGGAWILSYGHPASDREGNDAYFGRLMLELPRLRRVLHVDADVDRARRLDSSRTFSLHSYGTAGSLASLPSKRWRAEIGGPDRWLVRRAVAREAGTAQAAAIAWQIACQAGWLRMVRPRVVAWPWENHAWERAFVHEARRLGTRTVGYAHVPFNAREWNFGADTLADGRDGLPDMLVVCGKTGRDRLIAWGAPSDRVIVAGALRFEPPKPLRYDRNGPIFVALPAHPTIARELADAAAALARIGRSVVVKPHPLAPIAFSPQDGLILADRPLGEQEPLSVVIYASTTVGLEAIAGGIPTIRFLPEGTVGWAAPDGMPQPPSADAAALARAVAEAQLPGPTDWTRLAAPPDLETWRRLLQP